MFLLCNFFPELLLEKFNHFIEGYMNHKIMASSMAFAQFFQILRRYLHFKLLQLRLINLYMPSDLFPVLQSFSILRCLKRCLLPLCYFFNRIGFSRVMCHFICLVDVLPNVIAIFGVLFKSLELYLSFDLTELFFEFAHHVWRALCSFDPICDSAITHFFFNDHVAELAQVTEAHVFLHVFLM